MKEIQVLWFFLWTGPKILGDFGRENKEIEAVVGTLKFMKV